MNESEVRELAKEIQEHKKEQQKKSSEFFIERYKNLSKTQQQEVQKLHKQRYDIEKHMNTYALDDKNVLLHFREWKKNEFLLQEAWGFEKNELYHKDFILKHCSCGSMDNRDDFGIKRHYSASCILHGDKIQNQ